MTSPQNLSFTITAHDHMSSVLSRLGGMLKSFGIAAGAAIVGAGVAAATVGIKTAAAMEQSQIAFTNLLGSSEKAKGFLADLQKFAAETPFQFEDVTKASQKFLAMGFQYKDILPILTSVGDAVAGLGGGAAEIDRVTIALGQMNSKQKIQAEEMMQLTEVGIPAYQILADKMHMTVGELQTLMSQPGGGNAVFQMAGGVQALVDGIEHGTEHFKGFAGMMQQQSKTLIGLWSTLKDNVSMALMKAFEPALPALKRIIDGVSQAIPAIMAGFGQLGARIREIFSGSTVPQALMAALQKMGQDLLPKVKAALDQMLNALRDNRAGLESLGHFIANNVIPIVTVLAGTALANLVVGFRVVITVLGHLVDAFNLWRLTVGTVMQAIVTVFTGAAGMILRAADAAFGWIPGIGPKIHSARVQFDNEVDAIRRKIDQLDGKTATITISEIHRTVYTNVGSPPPSQYFRGLAGGGEFKAGEVAVVGEHGPELVVFGHSGVVVPNGQPRPVAPAGGGQMTVTFRGDTDSAFATAFMKLVRIGAIQIS